MPPTSATNEYLTINSILNLIDMAETTQSYADQIISEISTASGTASVTNVMVGRILDFFNKRLKAADSDLAIATQTLRSDIASLRADLDALDHDNATEAIESFREILAFLDGCKDDETLLAKLTEIKALITAEAADRQSAIAQALNSAQVADAELQEQIAALKKLVPVVELTAEEIAALLPADESQIATLELDAEDDVAGADQPATCEALERFRTRLREMRGRSVFKPKEVYNPNDYINSYEHE